MLVSEIMNPEIISILPEESVAYAARLLSRNNIGSVPVCGADGELKGIVTDRDIVLRVVATDGNPNATAVSEIMSQNIITIAPDDCAKKASKLMSASQVRRLTVVDDGKVVGIISLGDLAQCENFNVEAGEALSEISKNIVQE